MQVYDAVFSAPAYYRSGTGTIAPSLYGLYRVDGAGPYMYDRFAWGASEGKPWWGDAAEETGALSALFHGDPFSAPGGLSLDGSKPLDAALCLDNLDEIYLFQAATVDNVDTTLVRKFSLLDAASKAKQLSSDTYAQTIDKVFGDPHNKSTFAFKRIRGPLYSPKAGDSGKIWFFDYNSPNCVSIDADTHIQDQETSVPISSAWHLDGVPSGLVATLTTAGKPFWATTSIVTDAHHTDGQSQDMGSFGTGTDWSPFILSTTTPPVVTAPGNQPFTVPTGVTAVTLELWGPGGNGGDGGTGPGVGGAGGRGGVGAYLRQTNVTVSDQMTIHIGTAGDCTYYPIDSRELVAGGGGGGGGGGGSGPYGVGGLGGVGGDGGGGSGGSGGSTTAGGGFAGAAGGKGGTGTGTGTGGTGQGGGGGTGGGAGGGGGIGGAGFPGGGGGGGGGVGVGGVHGAGGDGGGIGSGYYIGDGGGGGGAQGPSGFPKTTVFKPFSDGDPHTPFLALGGFGGNGGGQSGGTGSPGGNGAARITW